MGGNMEPQLLVNRDGKAVMGDLMGAPGIPYTNCKAEVSDYHVTETQDMREKRREQDMRIQAILREEALHRKSQMTVDTLGGVQHTSSLRPRPLVEGTARRHAHLSICNLCQW